MKEPNILSYMTPFPYTIDTEETLENAKILMAEKNIRHLPVSHEGKLTGILSDRDLKRALDPVFELGKDNEVLVKQIMRRNPYVVTMDTPAAEVLETMYEKKYGAALITKENRLVGIFTSTDSCKICAELLREKSGS